MNKTIRKYKIDYLIITSIVGLIGFIAYEYFIMPYLITRISCESLVNNFNNERFSLINLKDLVHKEYDVRCIIESQSFTGVSGQ